MTAQQEAIWLTCEFYDSGKMYGHQAAYVNKASLIGKVRLGYRGFSTIYGNDLNVNQPVTRFDYLGYHMRLTSIVIPRTCKELGHGFISSSIEGCPYLTEVYVESDYTTTQLILNYGSLGAVGTASKPNLTVYLPRGATSWRYRDPNTLEIKSNDLIIDSDGVWQYYPDEMCRVNLDFWDPPEA